MNFPGGITLALAVAWLFIEIAISIQKRPTKDASGTDRRSLQVMWLSISIPITVITSLKYSGILARCPGALLLGSPYLVCLGCLGIVGGMALRLAAIRALGRRFTVQVSIVEGHRLMQEGLYRWVRHPSYLGSLISLTGLGLAMENWICMIVLVAVPAMATSYRISIEETVLRREFGPEYEAYAKKTKRLLPWIY